MFKIFADDGFQSADEVGLAANATADRRRNFDRLQHHGTLNHEEEMPLEGTQLA